MTGAQAELNGERLWDVHAVYPNASSEYCRTVCGATRCPTCSQPKLLSDAQPGVAAFLSVATQWRQGFGGRTGLDYTACIATLRMHLPRWRRESRDAFAGLRVAELMRDVQTIEAAMLTADAERRDRDEAERKTREPVT